MEVAIEATLTAGSEILRIYQGSAFGQYTKYDGSLVTDADLAADHVIRAVIQREFPGDAMLTEEGQDDQLRLQASRCWIVDPIDGTEQFIRRTDEFDVLVALTEKGRPVAVAGYQPTTSTLVIAEKGQGTWVSVRGSGFSRVTFREATDTIRISSSKWFGAPGNAELIDSIAEKMGQAAIIGSSNIGFSPRIFLSPREFDAMIGIRAGSNQVMASEWDFAVTDLVIGEAGGVVSDLAGQLFAYNKPIPTNNGGLVASVSEVVHERLLKAIQSVRTTS